MKQDALYWFRKLPKTSITVKTQTGTAFDPATGTNIPTYATTSELAYVGELSSEEIKALSVLDMIDNNLVNTTKKVVSLNEHDVACLISVGSTDYRIARKYQKAGIWIYGVEEK
jgi:hypothetical protein